MNERCFVRQVAERVDCEEHRAETLVRSSCKTSGGDGGRLALVFLLAEQSTLGIRAALVDMHRDDHRVDRHRANRRWSRWSSAPGVTRRKPAKYCSLVLSWVPKFSLELRSLRSSPQTFIRRGGSVPVSKCPARPGSLWPIICFIMFKPSSEKPAGDVPFLAYLGSDSVLPKNISYSGHCAKRPETTKQTRFYFVAPRAVFCCGASFAHGTL